MAHGSKKWITAYDGKVKRSRHRTKEDYYRDLRQWAPYASRYSSRKGVFCPQCKHNYKPIQAHRDAYRTEQQQIRKEWEAIEAKHRAEIDAYYARYALLRDRFGAVWIALNPPMRPAILGQKEKFWQERATIDYPRYDEECWLCPKCRLKFDTRDSMWWDHPHGRNRSYQWIRRNEYRKYRAKMKQALRNERYDDIIPLKHGWLD